MRYAPFALILAGAMLAGCARQAAFTPHAGAARNAHARGAASAYRLIYSFKGLGDGVKPEDRLVEHDGAFYGTTYSGGKYNIGTVFEVRHDGTEKVLYSFSSAYGDAGMPVGGLIYLGHVFYGTTLDGGSSNHGTVYEIKPDGTFRVIFNFNGGNGANPHGELINVFGVLYGTTDRGGALDRGTVFSVTPDGKEHVLHSFAGGADGENPLAGLELFDSHLYGTTYQGGAHNAGTVFEISPNGKERVLYSFAGGAGSDDGFNPESKLIAVNGALYGTTRGGGTGCCGTIFEVKKDGSEKIVYSLNHNDGGSPNSGLAALNGSLYGTAPRYGSKNQGTIFEVKPDGTFQVLHTFAMKEGAEPRSSLLAVHSKLYGTTAAGGAKQKGTVFELTP